QGTAADIAAVEKRCAGRLGKRVGETDGACLNIKHAAVVECDIQSSCARSGSFEPSAAVSHFRRRSAIVANDLIVVGFKSPRIGKHGPVLQEQTASFV